jgi:hypothetical protein
MVPEVIIINHQRNYVIVLVWKGLPGVGDGDNDQYCREPVPFLTIGTNSAPQAHKRTKAKVHTNVRLQPGKSYLHYSKYANLTFWASTTGRIRVE